MVLPEDLFSYWESIFREDLFLYNWPQEEWGEQVTIVTEMNGNSVQENGIGEKSSAVERSASEEEEQDNQKNELHETDEGQLKSPQDQKKSKDSICRYEQDVDDPSGQEVEKRDMSGNSVDEDILEFLDD